MPDLEPAHDSQVDGKPTAAPSQKGQQELAEALDPAIDEEPTALESLEGTLFGAGAA